MALGAMTALAPTFGSAAVDGNPDVVVVGAGAAGIAAAHALANAGTPFMLVEAADRVGGRAWTETTSFGVPFDVGARWIQNQTRNPYFERAKESPYRFYPATERYRVFDAHGEVSADGVAALWRTYDDVYTAIGGAGEQGLDVAPSQVVPDRGTWGPTAGFLIGPWEMAKDMDAFSCLDWWNSADSVDWYCAAGYGTLVADRAADLPVALETQVTRIRWDGPGVEVETTRGTIRARAVIVTVSTGVLASEGIVFDPALPAELVEAFHGITMGIYNHIALQFSQDIFAMGEDGYLLHQVDESMEAFGALTNASGTGIAYCDVGGSFAAELERAGEAAAIDFVVGKLRTMFGSEVDRTLVKGAVSSWGTNPLFRGAYASAAPGAYHLRPVLRQPVGDRIFLAGEACHRTMWATVGGADLSGREAADAVIRQLA